MAHPLDGACFRVGWAGQRLDDLKVRIDGLLDSDDDRVIPTIDTKNPEHIVVGLTQLKPPPLDLSVRVGEIVYHLRSALDYLVYAISRHDSGKTHRKTQFPIMDTPEMFQACRNTYLAGVSTPHAALFESYQPYKGCDWTRTLQRISNPDKHRELIVATVRATQTVIISSVGDHWEPDDLTNIVFRTQGHGGADVHVKLGVATQITLDDGSSIVETLQVLKSQVAETLEAFKAEF